MYSVGTILNPDDFVEQIIRNAGFFYSLSSIFALLSVQYWHCYPLELNSNLLRRIRLCQSIFISILLESHT